MKFGDKLFAHFGAEEWGNNTRGKRCGLIHDATAKAIMRERRKPDVRIQEDEHAGVSEFRLRLALWRRPSVHRRDATNLRGLAAAANEGPFLVPATGVLPIL